MKIEYVSTGIANRFEDHIELNENLPAYPDLYNSILEHELSHTDKEGFTKEDFILDLGPSKVNYWKLFIFMCKYPKTFTQFLPIYKKGNQLIYDINLIIVWGILLGIIGIAIFLGFKY